MSATFRLLLIEDNPGDVRLIREMLRSGPDASFEIEAAGTLGEGLLRLGAGAFDVVLVDLGLPDSQGLDTFAHVQKQAPRVAVLVLTGNDDLEVAIRAVESGAQDYLVKGQVTEELLRRAVRYARERMGIATALRTSEARYRGLVEEVRDGIWAIDREGYTTYANRRLADLVGRSSDELLGRPFLSFLDPDLAGPCEEYLERSRAGEAGEHEVEFLRPDGGRTYALIDASPISGEEGEHVGSLLAVRDITERRRAEKALRRSERKLGIWNRIATIFLTASDEEAYGQVLDVILEATESRHGIFGYVREDGALVTPSMTAGVWDECQVQSKDRVFPRQSWGDGIWSRALSENRTLCSNEALPVPTGHLPVAKAVAAPIALHGTVLGVIAVANRVVDYGNEEIELLEGIAGRIAPVLEARLERDRTEAERKRTAEALERSEALHRSVVENATDLILLIETDGTVRFASPSLSTSLGYSGIDVVGTNIFAYFHADELEQSLHDFENGIRSGFPAYPKARRIRHKDGTWKHFEYSAVNLLENPDVRAVVAVCRDVTDRQEATAALAASEERYRLLFEQSVAGIVSSKLDGEILDCNPTFARMLGYESPAALRGRNANTFYYEPGERPGLVARLLTDRTASNLEEIGRRKDGEKIVLLENAAIWGDERGQPPVIVRTVFDITDRKRAEDEIRKLNAGLERRVRARTSELEDAVRQMEAFSFSVSHDLRAPLRAIDGFAAKLERAYGATLDAEGRRLLETIQRNARHMGTLIEDLLRFSRTSRAEMRRTPIDMAALARKALADAVPAVRREQVEVSLGELPSARGDAALIGVVFQNLVSNAVKFSGRRESAVIEIGFRLGDNGPEYFVRDNGVGFDQKHAEKLFGVFQRFHDTNEFEGTGIGLALVKRIVDRHGGRVWAESEPGQGATFWFTLGRDPGSDSGPSALHSSVAAAVD